MKKVVVDSDIIVEHVSSSKYPSKFRQITSNYFCYTTVFNAIELFSICKTDFERETISEALCGIKILGMNPKPSKSFGKIYAKPRGKNSNNLSAFIGALCLESKLPLLTLRPKNYRWLPELQILQNETF